MDRWEVLSTTSVAAFVLGVLGLSAVLATAVVSLALIAFALFVVAATMTSKTPYRQASLQSMTGEPDPQTAEEDA